MKDYVGLYLKYLEWASEHLRVDTRDTHDCLDSVCADFRGSLNCGDVDSDRLHREAERIGVSSGRLEASVRGYFTWRKDFEAENPEKPATGTRVVDEDGNEFFLLKDR